MATRKKKTSGSHLGRSSWKGNLAFGLVSIPVEAFNALDRSGSDIHFHQLHAKCHNRISYQKVCPVHGVVDNSEIVSGYEHQAGQYIEVDPEELSSLRSESERALTIDAFVTQETVDPLYFDGRMYYLLPNGKAASESYSVVVAAMAKEERCGVGHIVFSGKDQIALIRPLENVLHLAMLNYDSEIQPPSKVAAGLKKHTGSTREIRLAQSLVREWSDDEFDLSQYTDTYREKLRELIEAKLDGDALVAPKEAKPHPEILNLMDALKKSLNHRPTQSKSGKKASQKRA